MALLREGRREVQRGGGLRDAALLVGECDDLGLAGHVVLRSRSGKPIEDGYSHPVAPFLLPVKRLHGRSSRSQGSRRATAGSPASSPSGVAPAVRGYASSSPSSP